MIKLSKVQNNFLYHLNLDLSMWRESTKRNHNDFFY